MLRLLMLVSLLCGAPASGFAAGRECGGRERPDRPDGLAVSAESPLFTFGVVTDVHYSNVKETWAARRYAESGEKLREAVAAFNRAHVDFVVSLGDMIDGDIGSYAVIRPILEGSAAPVYKILGNHDYLGPYGSEEQRRVLEELGISEPYFSVVRNGCRLLFLDSNDISVYARAKESPEYAEAAALLDSLKRSGAANAGNTTVRSEKRSGSGWSGSWPAPRAGASA